jgi:L-alanine-DL-glutamate epimerase-like enolase superfamily enzyme
MGKVKNQPIYQLLGGVCDRIPSYASTPMFENVSAYMDVIEELLNQGFRAIKFHTWCVPDQDLALAREARRQYPDLTLMLDAENNYDYASALRVAKELEALDFAWFEAPLPDWDLEGYRSLVNQVDMPVIPSGNWVQDLSLFSENVRTGVWKTTRTDVTILGGITPAREAMALSLAANMKCELMSWGYTLPSAANLHVMLGCGNCTYYEQPLPYETFEYGMHEVIRTQADGYVYAPKKPGLGLAIDWPAMERATIHRVVCDGRGLD